jgi:hypothetical protein
VAFYWSTISLQHFLSQTFLGKCCSRRPPNPECIFRILCSFVFAPRGRRSNKHAWFGPLWETSFANTVSHDNPAQPRISHLVEGSGRAIAPTMCFVPGPAVTSTKLGVTWVLLWFVWPLLQPCNVSRFAPMGISLCKEQFGNMFGAIWAFAFHVTNLQVPGRSHSSFLRPREKRNKFGVIELGVGVRRHSPVTEKSAALYRRHRRRQATSQFRVSRVEPTADQATSHFSSMGRDNLRASRDCIRQFPSSICWPALVGRSKPVVSPSTHGQANGALKKMSLKHRRPRRPKLQADPGVEEPGFQAPDAHDVNKKLSCACIPCAMARPCPKAC